MPSILWEMAFFEKKQIIINLYYKKIKGMTKNHSLFFVVFLIENLLIYFLAEYLL